MATYKRIKAKCPGCGAMYKIVMRCKSCQKMCCAICSINGLCIDCFTNINAQGEILMYAEEKGHEVMTI